MLSRHHGPGRHGECVAVKDTQLVYRACTVQFAKALGFESPADIIGKSDQELLSGDVANAQLTLDSEAVSGGQAGVGTLVLDNGAELVVVRTPILSTGKKVRGIDVRLLRSNAGTPQFEPKAAPAAKPALSPTPESASVRTSSTAVDSTTDISTQAVAKGGDPAKVQVRRVDSGTSSTGINYQSLVEQGLQGSLVLQDDRIVFANRAAARTFGLTRTEGLLDLRSAAPLFAREGWTTIRRAAPSLHEQSSVRLLLDAYTVDGDELKLLAKSKEITWQGARAVLLSFVDLGDQMESDTDLPESERRFRHYARASADFFWELDDQLRFSYISDELDSIPNLTAADLIGLTHEEILKSDHNTNADDHWDQQLDRLNRHQAFRDFEFRWGNDEDARTLRYSGIPIYDTHHVFIGFRGTGRDVTAANRQAESVAYHANHDALTGLVNRRHFEQLCERALEKAKRERRAHALCFMDLDSFKIVNDTCGHLAGDELLRQLSALLDGLVRKSDVLARLGGDEFGLLLYNCSVSVALNLANQLRSEVENFQFLWGDSRFQVGVSIGLVVFDDRWQNLQALFGAADSACYLAKNEGRNRVVVHHDGDGPSSNRKVETHWVEEINAALDEDRMAIARQVILPLGDQNDVSRFEMFMRLRATNGDIINPGAFLPSAERYGLSARLDLVMIELTLKWMKNNPRLLNSVRLCSINLTSGSFANPENETAVTELIANSGIPASKLCFELTETATIANLSSASRFMHRLHDMGCHFMLDDFGSGLSAFAYLKNLPVDYLKIDGSLVRDILDDQIDFTMVKAINEISQSLGMQTVAKYVESPQLLDAVRELGIDFAQGYYLGKPEIIDA
ncbi:MAG: EAL domain-containing protein [Gammaproteobacteria bacterium]|nr:EAL domain-containing protein [Gammaproteobacteria bacterium]